jgi:ribonuclease HI
VEKLCLSLYYACSKLRYYLLSDTCIVACCHDVVRHMMQKPILSGRMGKWVHSLVEFDLVFKPFRMVRGQVVADFIVDHGMEVDDTCLVNTCPWTLVFDGSVCLQGCGIGYVMKCPSGAVHEMVARLEFKCTNNQVEYEALLAGLEAMIDVGAKDVEAFRDSQLVVQLMRGESLCLDSILNNYQEKCMSLVEKLDTIYIEHVPCEKNKTADDLARQTSGYEITRGRFVVQAKPTWQQQSSVCAEEGEAAPGVNKDIKPGDWRHAIRECVKGPSSTRDRKM